MKEEMIFFEKIKRFNEKMYEIHSFSETEILSLKNNQNLNKMFDVMEMETTLNVFNNLFACMISNIIYQQVAFKVARYSEVCLFDYLDYDITPEKILSLDEKTLKRFKIFGKRIEYIRNFSKFSIENKQFYVDIDTLSNKDIYSRLIKIPGIGEWSIEMFFIFGLARSDILSLKDLIIVRGLNFLCGECDLSLEKSKINSYGTIASINLWKFIERDFYKKLK